MQNKVAAPTFELSRSVASNQSFEADGYAAAQFKRKRLLESGPSPSTDKGRLLPVDHDRALRRQQGL
jgi:hypothetical protein